MRETNLLKGSSDFDSDTRNPFSPHELHVWGSRLLSCDVVECQSHSAWHFLGRFFKFWALGQ